MIFIGILCWLAYIRAYNYDLKNTSAEMEQVKNKQILKYMSFSFLSSAAKYQVTIFFVICLEKQQYYINAATALPIKSNNISIKHCFQIRFVRKAKMRQ